VAQLGRRHQEQEASQPSGARARIYVERASPSHRPQHDGATLVPRRRSPQLHVTQRRQTTLPPHWNQWSRREDHTTRPRRCINGGLANLHKGGGFPDHHPPQGGKFTTSGGVKMMCPFRLTTRCASSASSTTLACAHREPAQAGETPEESPHVVP
jgi:hypothetical protein